MSLPVFITVFVEDFVDLCSFQTFGSLTWAILSTVRYNVRSPFLNTSDVHRRGMPSLLDRGDARTRGWLWHDICVVIARLRWSLLYHCVPRLYIDLLHRLRILHPFLSIQAACETHLGDVFWLNEGVATDLRLTKEGWWILELGLSACRTVLNVTCQALLTIWAHWAGQLAHCILHAAVILACVGGLGDRSDLSQVYLRNTRIFCENFIYISFRFYLLRPMKVASWASCIQF